MRSRPRHAEAIGADIAQGDQEEIDRAIQLQLPLEIGPKVPLLYIPMDGTGVPVRKSETEGRKGKNQGQPARTREVKLGCVFTQTGLDEEGYPIRDPGSTTYVGVIETAEQFGKRLYVEAWKRGWSQADKKVVIGDGAGILLTNTSRVRSRSLTSSTPASICGTSLAPSILWTSPHNDAGFSATSPNSTPARSKS